jgi:ABC-type multidrug transport system fused ATPase/permease subunit
MRSETTGRIVIDGVDTSMIPRRTLRQRLSIIPQAPVVFTGTVRWNLDPAHQYTDDALWMALAKCAIADKIRSLPHQYVATLSLISVIPISYPYVTKQ